MKRYKLRLIFRSVFLDENGATIGSGYYTDDVYQPTSANVFKSPDVQRYGFLPELIGGEWIEEKNK